MLLPLTVALVAVGLGTWLALGPPDGARIVRPIRLVALVAALAVIATHLLPEAFHELGIKALAGFAAGLALPSAADAIAATLAKQGGSEPTASVAALEISYAGLLAHRFGDGLSMGAIARASSTQGAALAVLLALAAHIVPVTTVMIIAAASLRGRRAALFHAGGLAVATMAGVLIAGRAVAGNPRDASPWISAIVAGLLLHIVAPEMSRRRAAVPPEPRKW